MVQAVARARKWPELSSLLSPSFSCNTRMIGSVLVVEAQAAVLADDRSSFAPNLKVTLMKMRFGLWLR